ncbi:MAG: D-alanyl-D-alanine carboxypeptidase [Clostridiales bacterium]|nr:D-alanyl-D-alanine carboxypeptidase [Clostridiales bacterium]
MKRFLSIVLILTMLLALPASWEPAFAGNDTGFDPGEVPYPEIEGASGILIDAVTGEILWEKNIHEPHYPASTTKIMTAILAIEKLDFDDLLPVDRETAFTGGSRIYLIEGEEITVGEAMYGMMLESANDVAVALAKKMGGDVKGFAEMMNQRAKELGALNTNFVNPNGLHDKEHVSTAYDLAMMAKYAYTLPTFMEYCGTYRHTIPATNKQETRYMYNTNRLLYDTSTKVYVNGIRRTPKYDGILGMKTGWTTEARGCLVACAERNGTTLIAVSMNSSANGRFTDCMALMDWGFDNYQTTTVLNGGAPMGTVPVKRGSVLNVSVEASTSALATLKLNQSLGDITMETNLFDSLQAPVSAGETAGTVKLFLGDKFLGEYMVVTSEEIPEGGILSRFGVDDATASKIWRGFAIGFASLALVCCLIALYLHLMNGVQWPFQRSRRRSGTYSRYR